MNPIASKALTATTAMLVIWGPCFAGSENYSLRDHPDEKSLYQLKAGDTLRGLARQFLGGEEFFRELLEYNKISNPLLVGEGFMLMLPGKERKNAIRELIKSRNILAMSVDAQAEEFAPGEFLAAKEAIDAAEENRRIGAYDKATALAQLGLVRAQHAIKIADENARIQQGGKITAVQGLVEISFDSEKSWREVSLDDEFTVKAIIRTGSTSRAELNLTDGTIIHLLESTKFTLNNFIYDLRNGKRTSQLQVILGNILGKIKPKEVEQSTFEVKSGSAALAIRGTELRIGSDFTQTTRISVLDGDILVKANQKEMAIPGNFGTFIEKDRAPVKPVKLLPVPTILSPTSIIHETAIQDVDFFWDHVKIVPEKMTQKVTKYLFKKFASYHLEIATDVLFNHIIQNHITTENNFMTGVLAPGEYYWRLSSIDNNGLEGPSSQVRKLQVIRDLRIDIVSEFLPLEKYDKWITRPSNTFYAVPIQSDSSVESLEFSLNRGPFELYDDNIILKKDGQYLLRVKGVGADGYHGDIIEQLIEIDGTPPIIAMDISPIQDDIDLGEVVYVTINVIDNTELESLQYKINDEDFQPYTEPIAISLAREPGGVYLKGGTLFGKVILDKNLRRNLKTKILCHAVDIVGNESFESISLKY